MTSRFLRYVIKQRGCVYVFRGNIRRAAVRDDLGSRGACRCTSFERWRIVFVQLHLWGIPENARRNGRTVGKYMGYEGNSRY